MKTFKSRVLVAVVFMLGTLFNYANDVVSEDIIGTKKVKVVFENVEKGQLLTVKDSYGNVLYSENIYVEGDIVKFFDFSSLNEGFYKVELDKRFQIITKSFELKLNRVTFQPEIKNIAKKEFIKPVINVNKDNVIRVSRINVDKEIIRVVIYYDGDILLDEDVSTEKASIIRRYQLNKEKEGDYRVVVKISGKRFVSKFSI